MPFDLDKMYCGAIRRGDVFLFENEKGEQNAVLILQDNILNDGLSTVVCAALEPYEAGTEVLVNEVLLRQNETGLGKDAICMLHRIMTLDRIRLVAKKGELKEDRLQDVYRALDISLGRFRDKKK